jgi:hypothetical protein
MTPITREEAIELWEKTFPAVPQKTLLGMETCFYCKLNPTRHYYIINFMRRKFALGYCDEECYILNRAQASLLFNSEPFRANLLSYTNNFVCDTKNYLKRNNPMGSNEINAVCSFCSKRLFKHNEHTGSLFVIEAKNKKIPSILIKICDENCRNLWLLKKMGE